MRLFSRLSKLIVNRKYTGFYKCGGFSLNNISSFFFLVIKSLYTIAENWINTGKYGEENKNTLIILPTCNDMLIFSYNHHIYVHINSYMYTHTLFKKIKTLYVSIHIIKFKCSQCDFEHI